MWVYVIQNPQVVAGRLLRQRLPAYSPPDLFFPSLLYYMNVVDIPRQATLPYFLFVCSCLPRSNCTELTSLQPQLKPSAMPQGFSYKSSGTNNQASRAISSLACSS